MQICKKLYLTRPDEVTGYDDLNEKYKYGKKETITIICDMCHKIEQTSFSLFKITMQKGYCSIACE